MCVQSIKVAIQKKSGNLLYVPRIYLPNPLYDTRSIFKWSLTCLNSEFSFLSGCHTKVKESSLPNYLPINGGRIVEFIPVPKVLTQCEMLIALSRIWTQVTMSIPNDDIHCTMSIHIYVCLYKCMYVCMYVCYYIQAKTAHYSKTLMRAKHLKYSERIKQLSIQFTTG